MSSIAEPEILEVLYEPDCSPEQLTQVLSALDRSSGRTARHVTHLRSSERHEYRTTVIIEPRLEPSAKTANQRHIICVPTRNVSKNGLGFIAPSAFRPKMKTPAEGMRLLRSDAIFRVGIEVKIKLGPKDGKMPIVKGIVTRVRPVSLGYFDIGVRFVMRDE